MISRLIHTEHHHTEIEQSKALQAKNNEEHNGTTTWQNLSQAGVQVENLPLEENLQNADVRHILLNERACMLKQMP